MEEKYDLEEICNSYIMYKIQQFFARNRAGTYEDISAHVIGYNPNKIQTQLGELMKIEMIKYQEGTFYLNT